MMTQAQLATASLNDIVFDGRNKEYGAYELRALYERHVRQALAWASVVLLLLLAYPVVSRLLADTFPPPVVKTSGVIKLIDVMPVVPPMVVPPVAPPVAPPSAPLRTASLQFTPPVVDRDDHVMDDKVPEQEALLTTPPGLTTVQGPASTEIVPRELEEGPKTVSEAVEVKIYTYVEQYPEVVAGGGVASIVAAIQKAVKYPAIDLRNGMEGRIFASFIVSSTGEITEVKIVKGLSETLNAETLRAIGTLPKLIPARQNGKAVNVSFTVPITYKIQ